LLDLALAAASEALVNLSHTQSKEDVMRNVKRLLLALVIGIAGWLTLADAVSAQLWPQRSVRVIVPLPPGTAIDVSARLFAEHLGARWRHPVIVENMPGADGIFAAREFVGKRDNHTLLYSFAGPITINPLLYEKLPYDPAHDLVPIAMSSDNFLAVAASAKLAVHSLDELVKFARSRTTKLNWAATSGLPYFAVAGLQKSARIEMVYVPYRDFNPALADLGEGRIDVASTALTQMLPHNQAGKLTFLAVINRMRSPLAPDVPTATEAGYPDLTFDGVTGFFGWREMPVELRDRIAADVRVVANNPAVKERLATIGIVARGSTPSEFAAAIEEQRAKVTAIAAAIGMKPTQ
jgi:tripartite-type tricarboxylate transporter receptor subunit TctC